jgi:DNA-binding response OmpR family regulator
MNILIFDDDVADDPAAYGVTPRLSIRVFDRADDCLALIDEYAAQLVFMDYHLRSGMKGEEAVRLIRRVWPPGTLTVVGISSSRDLNARIEAAGADESFLKPQLPERLAVLELTL